MSGSHPRYLTATLGVAGGGLVLGHWLAYAIGSPDATARDELLATTGHGYLPYATQVAMLAATTAIVGLFAARLAGRRATGRSFGADVAGLAALQSVAFVALEASERLLSGAPLHDMTHTPLLAVGLAVQLVVAAAGALALRLTERAAEVIQPLGRSAALPTRSVATVLTCPRLGAPVRPALRATASRAPPPLPCIDI